MASPSACTFSIIRRPILRPFTTSARNVSIETGDIIEGYLPATAARMVKQWTLAHQTELKANWDRARAKMALERIAGLDAD
jgi:hypothetical protein